MTVDRDRFPVVVHVLVYRESTIAMLKRANTGFMDGYYALPGGHQQHGELVSQAARRECEEELGIEVVELTPACVLPYRSGRHQGINFLFACRAFEGTPVINEPELFDELIWADPGALPEPCAEWVPTVLELTGRGGWFGEMEWD
jgi:8-oxo-dGTP pyrophosphatase MutT (NUDIX family)